MIVFRVPIWISGLWISRPKRDANATHSSIHLRQHRISKVKTICCKIHFCLYHFFGPFLFHFLAHRASHPATDWIDRGTRANCNYLAASRSMWSRVWATDRVLKTKKEKKIVPNVTLGLIWDEILVQQRPKQIFRRFQPKLQKIKLSLCCCNNFYFLSK